MPHRPPQPFRRDRLAWTAASTPYEGGQPRARGLMPIRERWPGDGRFEDYVASKLGGKVSARPEFCGGRAVRSTRQNRLPGPERGNLLAPERRRREGARSCATADVAPALSEYWKEAPPFEGRIRRLPLRPRPEKHEVAGDAQALRCGVAQSGVSRIRVLFLATGREPATLGARWLRPTGPSGSAAFPGPHQARPRMLREVRLWGVRLHRYGLRSSRAAPDPLQALAGRWRRIASGTVAPHPHVTVGFDLLANHLGSPLTDPLRHLDRVRTDPRELAVLPDRYGSFLEPRAYWSPPYPGPEGRSRAYVTLPPPGRSVAVLRASRRCRGERHCSDPHLPTSRRREPYLHVPANWSPSSTSETRQEATTRVFFRPVPTAGAYTTRPSSGATGSPLTATHRSR